jgi:hypothetical protein
MRLSTKNLPSRMTTVPSTLLWRWEWEHSTSAEIAKVLRSDFRGETVEIAAYALAKLGAREYAKDIAKLLSKEWFALAIFNEQSETGKTVKPAFYAEDSN